MVIGSALASVGASVVSSAFVSSFVVSACATVVVSAGAAVVASVLLLPQPASDAATRAAIINGNAFFIMFSSFNGFL